MLTLTTDTDFTIPTVTLDGDKLHGITSFEVKYSTKGKAKGLRFKVSIPTPEIVDGTPKFVSKTYTVTTPQVEETEIIIDERASTLDKIRELSAFWEKNQTASLSSKKVEVAPVDETELASTSA
tara:strand:- start:763 stop:1134 length:372 start_codon:yes stop_codon:yes gene_type:complete